LFPVPAQLLVTCSTATKAVVETWDETGVNRIRAEKKLKAGN